MTTQAELIALASNYESHPAVRALLLSLREGRFQANIHLEAVAAMAATYADAVRFHDGHMVPLGSHPLVTKAAEASAAMTRVASDCLTLSCVLTSLGADISY